MRETDGREETLMFRGSHFSEKTDVCFCLDFLVNHHLTCNRHGLLFQDSNPYGKWLSIESHSFNDIYSSTNRTTMVRGKQRRSFSTLSWFLLSLVWDGVSWLKDSPSLSILWELGLSWQVLWVYCVSDTTQLLMNLSFTANPSSLADVSKEAFEVAEKYWCRRWFQWKV